MRSDPTKTIKVDFLARVEGEGGLIIRYRGDEVRDVQLRLFEPPRFFEAFLRGRSMFEVPDITARICGICPVAYQMSSCHALERAVGVKVDGSLRELRRLLYCGEWIESHVLHAFMLHAPDFLGCQDAIELAARHKDKVKMGLRLKKAGNAIVNTLGGREIHPINVRLGGFYRAPTAAELRALLPELCWGQGAARDALEWMATLPFPDMSRDYLFVALRHEGEYPMNEGRVVSSQGLDIDVSEYEEHFVEVHAKHSTALHSTTKDGAAYFCGPMARFNLNFDRLPPRVREAADRIKLAPPVTNPFKSILVRMVETCLAFDEAVRIVEAYVAPSVPSVTLPLRVGTGMAATEAPRGLLYHRYAIDADGLIETAKIVPPTSQNQRSIEDDLRAIAPGLLAMPREEATWRAEHAVRNYDPCISCSTHFLKVRFESC